VVQDLFFWVSTPTPHRSLAGSTPSLFNLADRVFLKIVFMDELNDTNAFRNRRLLLQKVAPLASDSILLQERNMICCKLKWSVTHLGSPLQCKSICTHKHNKCYTHTTSLDIPYMYTISFVPSVNMSLNCQCLVGWNWFTEDMNGERQSGWWHLCLTKTTHRQTQAQSGPTAVHIWYTT